MRSKEEGGVDGIGGEGEGGGEGARAVGEDGDAVGQFGGILEYVAQGLFHADVGTLACDVEVVERSESVEEACVETSLGEERVLHFGT